MVALFVQGLVSGSPSDRSALNSAVYSRPCEGGIRAPFIVRWPGKVKPATTSDFPFAFWDMMPTLAETEKFVANQDPQRYEKLVDALLDSKDYADYFASKWSAILRNRRTFGTMSLPALPLRGAGLKAHPVGNFLPNEHR